MENPKVNFIGIGVSKCGTNWIRTSMRSHPEIYLPQHDALKYFDSSRYDNRLGGFIEQFDAANNQKAIGEFTPRYYCSTEAMERIFRHFPEAKIIISLRNPIDRAISQYRYQYYYHKKEQNKLFAKALKGEFASKYIDKSLYFKYLEKVFKLFSRQQIHIIKYQDIVDQPVALLSALYEFLDVDPAYAQEAKTEIVNATPDKGLNWQKNIGKFLGQGNLNRMPARSYLSKTVKELKFMLSGKTMADLVITDEDKNSLYQNHFKEDIEKLEVLTAMDFSEWKRLI